MKLTMEQEDCREKFLTRMGLIVGAFAGSEAAARAGRSRDLGNVVHFCRWREIERMIELLSSFDRADATVH